MSTNASSEQEILLDDEDNQKSGLFTLRMDDELREKLKAVQKAMRFPHMTHTIRILIEDAYERVNLRRDGTNVLL